VILYAESSFSKNEYFKIWQAIQNNEIKIILGTRSAVFAPFANLEMLIVSDSHSEDYKQYDQNPRYEAVNVALKVQELINCRLILSSLTPRLEDAHLAKKEKFLSMTLGKSDFPGIKIVNLTEERKERFTYLSDKLINCLKEKIKNGERSLLIVNRRGEFTYCFCADCGFEAVCPECGLPYSIVGEKLVCFRCRNEIPFFSNCPKCKGANFKKIGAGINKIKTDLEAGLGVQVENVETKKPITETNVYLSSGKNLSQKAFDKIGFLGFVYADGLVHLTDFNSDFKLFGFLQELIGRVRADNSNAEIIVQTCFPENIAFNSLNKGYGEFYRGEMKVREDFGYPPFYTILKCIFQHHDEAVAKREAASLFEKLKNKVEQAQGRITEPYLHYTKRVRRRFRIQIVIFIPSAGAEQIEKELAEEIPDYWIIDKNPIDLL
jgi:primosomal protein N' (replication factor Y)